jgi:hypothetical protein
VTGIVLAVCLAACVMVVGRMGAGPTTPAGDTAALDALAERAEQAWLGVPDSDANEDVRELRTRLHTARMFHKAGRVAEARPLYQAVLDGCERLLHTDDPPPES